MQQFTLKGADHRSEIRIETGCLKRAADACREQFSPSRVHIVTDSTVAPLYLDTLRGQFSVPVSETVFPAGEQSKHLGTVETIYHDLLQNGLTRKDLIIALGGGVTGDIAGFAAATFLRGVSLCQIPTTLLAQVDSSVGGKTGVDLPEGKNLVGAFYQPHLVLIDPALLHTLPKQTFSDGMAEVVKYGYIADPAILDQIRSPRFPENIEEIITACVAIKRDVVQQDEHDTGLRMILNFGHTIGHAAEKLGGFAALTHGQGVAIGMVQSMRLAALTGSDDHSEELIALLTALHLPTELCYDREAIFQALLSDKKKMGDTVNFVFVRTPGKATVEALSTEALQALLQKL